MLNRNGSLARIAAVTPQRSWRARERMGPADGQDVTQARGV